VRLTDLKWKDQRLRKKTCLDSKEELNRKKLKERDLRNRLRRKLSSFSRDSRLSRKKRRKD